MWCVSSEFLHINCVFGEAKSGCLAGVEWLGNAFESVCGNGGGGGTALRMVFSRTVKFVWRPYTPVLVCLVLRGGVFITACC